MFNAYAIKFTILSFNEPECQVLKINKHEKYKNMTVYKVFRIYHWISEPTGK